MDRYKKSTLPYLASSLFAVYYLCIGISTTASDGEFKQGAATQASLLEKLACLYAFLNQVTITTAAPEQQKPNKENNIPEKLDATFIKPECPDHSSTKLEYYVQRNVQRWTEVSNQTKRYQLSSSSNAYEYPTKHKGAVITLALSPDSSTLISGSEDNALKLWDLSTNQCIATFNDHTGDILYVRWFTSGNTFASVSKDGTIKLRDKQSGKITRIYNGFTFKAHNKKSGKITDVATPFNFVHQNAIAWHPKVPVLAIGGTDGYLTLIDLNTDERISCTHAHLDTVTAVSWSLDGTMLATGSWSEPLMIWNVSKMDTLTRYSQWSTDAELISSLRFSPNGNRLASVSGNSISIWDISTKTTPKLHKTLTHHNHPVSSLDWHPNGVQIASASIDKQITITNTIDGSTTPLKAMIQHHARTAKWSHDGKTLFVGFSNGGIEIRRPTLPAQQPTQSKSNE